MQHIRSQQGLSLISGLFLFAVVAFVASTLFKIFPHYLDNRALEKSITQVEKDPTLNINTLSDLRAYLSKSMQVNTIELDKDAIQTSQDNNTFVIKVNYEKREPLIKNIDLVLNFDKEYRVRMP